MGPLEILFLAIFLFFVFICLARGYPKELGITTVIFAALFLIMQFLTPYLPQALQWLADKLGLGVIDPRTMQHILALTFSLLFIGIIFAGYAGQTFTFPGNQRKGVEGLLLNILVGAVNGYLVAGSLWYFQDFYDYPVADFTNLGGTPYLLDLPLTATAQAITTFLPPALVPSLAWGALLILMLLLRVRR